MSLMDHAVSRTVRVLAMPLTHDGIDKELQDLGHKNEQHSCLSHRFAFLDDELGHGVD